VVHARKEGIIQGLFAST